MMSINFNIISCQNHHECKTGMLVKNTNKDELEQSENPRSEYSHASSIRP